MPFLSRLFSLSALPFCLVVVWLAVRCLRKRYGVSIFSPWSNRGFLRVASVLDAHSSELIGCVAFNVYSYCWCIVRFLRFCVFKVICDHSNCFLCTPIDDIRTFRNIQQQIFTPAYSPKYTAASIYDNFFSNTPATNHDHYTNDYVEKLYVNNTFQDEDLVPSSLVIANTIQKHRSTILLKALFDPGLDYTFIHQ